jgi:hypothetical protein
MPAANWSYRSGRERRIAREKRNGVSRLKSALRRKNFVEDAAILKQAGSPPELVDFQSLEKFLTNLDLLRRMG